MRFNVKGASLLFLNCPFAAMTVRHLREGLSFPTTFCSSSAMTHSRCTCVGACMWETEWDREVRVCICRSRSLRVFCGGIRAYSCLRVADRHPLARAKKSLLTCLWPLRKTVCVTSQGPTPRWLKAAGTISRPYMAGSDRIASAPLESRIRSCFVSLYMPNDFRG